MIEKAQKHAWKLLFALGVFFLVFALPALLGVDPDPIHSERIMGMTLEELKASDPKFFDVYVFDTRNVGLLLLVFAILAMAISATAYRRGEKWAWYALWSVPVWFIGSAAISLSVEPPVSVLLPPIMVFAILGLLGQVLSYRKFFGGK